MSNLRQQESDRKRARVLATARALFGEQGYKAVSTDVLAGAADVSKGLVFAFYGTKQGLFAAVIDQVLEEVIAYSERRIKPGASALDKLEATFRAGFDYIRQQPQIMTLLSQDGMLAVPEILAKHRSHWIAAFSALLQEAADQQELAEPLAVAATGEVIYHLHKELLEELLRSGNVDAVSPQKLDAALALIRRGIGAGI
jgi:AcrR family transcriptional regulator